MRKYQIAMVGAFDVENYGDLLFPIVFENEMKKRGLEFDLKLFSYLDTAIAPLLDDKKVHSFMEFEKMNEKLHFDVLIVGGGAIIHFGDGLFISPNTIKPKRYSVVSTWLPYIYIAAKNDMKILFNLPQIPVKIPEELRKLAKTIFDQVDYLAVRDKYSKEFIQEVYNGDASKIEVYPDAVFMLDKIYPVAKLNEIRKSLGLEKKYMIFHQQALGEMTEEQLKEAQDIISDALKRGLEVVLLPIGNTHGDDKRVRKINERTGNKCVILEKSLSLIDITSILAGAEYYIGYSFHGSVVTMLYGGRAFSLKVCNKNRELYESAGLVEFLDDNCPRLLNKVDKVLGGEIGYKFPKRKIQKKVERHFDNIYREIVGKKMKKKDADRILLDMVAALSLYKEEVEVMRLENDNNLMEYKNKENRYRNELSLVKNSTAFKIGKKITWLPHKIKNKLR